MAVGTTGADVLRLANEADAFGVLAATRRAAPDAIAGGRVIDIVAEAQRRWSLELEWRDEVARLLATWPGHMDVSDELADLEAMLDPATWSAKLATEWPAQERTDRIAMATLPLGIVLHVCPGNGVATSLWTTLHGVLAGNQNLVKLSGRSPAVAPIIVELLVRSGLPRAQVRFISWPHEAERIRQTLLENVDGLAVWGDQTTIESFRNGFPSGVRWIERGPRLSVSIVTRRQRSEATFSGVAADVSAREQRNCSSTQCLLVELGEDEPLQEVRASLLHQVSAAFAVYAAAHPPLRKSNDAQLEMLKRLELAKLARLRREGDFVSGYPDWLVIWENEGPIKASCLFRTLYMRPFRTNDELSVLLSQVRRYLQTASLACSASERPVLVDLLWRCGINRIVSAGQSAVSVAAAPQDGRFLLPEFLRIATDEQLCSS